MKTVIEPTDCLGIVYAILQIRRCVPLKIEREGEYGRRIAERCAYHGSTTRLGVNTVDKGGGSSVHGCGVGGIVFKASVLDQLANNHGLLKAEERIYH